MAEWYKEKAVTESAVVSTRIRLARNILGIPFPSGMSASMREELKQRVKNIIKGSDTPFAEDLKYIDMCDVPELEIGAMVERHIISPEFARFKEGRAIILSSDETISIMIGEEDHIRIQVILAGLQLEKAYEIAEKLDNLLNEALHFAFDSELGYLTECPTNLGTGLRASVMLHLPLLESKGQLPQLSEAVGKIGFTVRGLYGEGSKSAASLYQISNQVTLGVSEKNSIDNLSVITEQLLEKEKQFEEGFSKIALEDKIYRALGVLKSCRILKSREMINLISLIKLGVRMGILTVECNPLQVLIDAQPNMLMKKYGNLSPEERDIKRAEFIREQFN